MNKLAKSLLVVALLSGGAVSAQKVQTASQRQVEIAATVEHPPNSLTLEFRQDCQWSYTQGCDRLGVTIYLYFCK